MQYNLSVAVHCYYIHLTTKVFTKTLFVSLQEKYSGLR